MRLSHAEFDRTLAAAVGDEPALADDLARAFEDGVRAHRRALGRARDAIAWTKAAARLEGLAASFAARELMSAAAAARIAVPGSAASLTRIDIAIAVMGVDQPAD